MDIRKCFDPYFLNKKILILGFGREGKSAYQFIREYYPDAPIGVADRYNVELPPYDSFTATYCGENYLDALLEYDLVIKSPGISLPAEFRKSSRFTLTSQTEIFLDLFSEQIIGITGTKGKSTTASLLYHLLQCAGRKTLLGGNIGRPVFELLPEITLESVIVLELSSHQLQYIKTSPRIAILLNIYPEHLDYYKNFEEYKLSKMNITLYQKEDDLLIYPMTEFLDITTQSEKKGFLVTEIKNDSANIKFKMDNGWQQLKINRQSVRLPGEHNLFNIGAAVIAARLAGCSFTDFEAGIYSFQGLKHRLQEVAEIDRIRFINDSISTIPETTIAALKVYDHCVESLVLGGHSRGEGISFKKLAEELLTCDIDNIFLLPETGQKIYEELLISGAVETILDENSSTLEFNSRIFHCFFVNDFNTIISLVFKNTSRHKKNKICLLSPASTSYNMFKNFEDRGDAFISAVLQYNSK